MRRFCSLAFVALVLAAPAAAQTRAVPRQSADTAVITIRAARVLDGRGGDIDDAIVTIRGRRIASVVPVPPAAHPRVTYDLGDATLMPGLIDAHVHPGWYINGKGTLHYPGDGDTREHSALARAGNLYKMLMAGFTTVQSVGGPEDAELRAAIERGDLPGPRLLTSLEPFLDTSLTADSLRALVRVRKAQGANVIKLFASAGLGAGGGQTFSDAQLRALCGEAEAQGLRTVVHAISAQSVRAATLAGCTEIEHGTYATPAELTLMAQHGTIFDPQVCLVFQNYLDHRDVYTRSGFTEHSFETLRNALPVAAKMFGEAIRTPGLKIIFGTDAVALAHGHNADELVCRVRAGEPAMDAIVSATSRAAEALGIADSVGTVAAGMVADLVAVPGDPRSDITVMRRVGLVARGGVVVRAR